MAFPSNFCDMNWKRCRQLGLRSCSWRRETAVISNINSCCPSTSLFSWWVWRDCFIRALMKDRWTNCPQTWVCILWFSKFLPPAKQKKGRSPLISKETKCNNRFEGKNLENQSSQVPKCVLSAWNLWWHTLLPTTLTWQSIPQLETLGNLESWHPTLKTLLHYNYQTGPMQVESSWEDIPTKQGSSGYKFWQPSWDEWNGLLTHRKQQILATVMGLCGMDY